MTPTNLAKVLLDDQVTAGRASAPAIVCGGRTVSYGELQAQVDRAGHALRALGVRPADRVVLRMPNSQELIAAWLALQKIGATAVTTATALRARELVQIIRDARPAVCVVDPGLRAELERAEQMLDRMPPVLSSSELAGREGALEPHLPIEPDAVPAVIAYTSGIEADAKGVCHSPHQILAATDAYAGGVLGLTASDVIGGVIPLSFAYGLGALLVFPLRFGASVVLDEEFNPDLLLSTIANHHVTVLFGTATCYRLLLRVADVGRRFDLRSLRICVSAGEPLEAEVTLEWMRRTGVDLIDSFGTTEMFHVFLASHPGAVVPGSVGVPVPGYEVKLVDERFEEVPVDTPGRLAVRGRTACRYWRRGAQGTSVRDGWHLTGDLLIKDRRGHYWFHRRADDLIVSAGYNISPAEVEQALLSHPAVAEAAVVGVPDQVRHRIAAAVLVVRPDARLDPDVVAAVHAHVQTELASFKCPRRYEIVDTLPRTPEGAPDRQAVRRRLAT
jgi:2-aminobenzoate-CoA ligase